MKYINKMNSMLCDDIIVYICTFLRNYDKIQFLSTCSYFHTLKNKVCFDGKRWRSWSIVNPIPVSKIKDLWYFDRFTHVEVDCDILKIPQCATNLLLNTGKISHANYFYSNIRCLTINGTRSYFGYDYSPHNLIPSTVTKLVWINPLGDDYLRNRIPPNVTSLTIRSYHNLITNFCLPDTIIDLLIENYTTSHIRFTIEPSIKNTLVHWCDPN